MTPVSIFNDVIGPVMRGPSSSHCAAALRIGRLARDLMDGEIEEVLVEFDRAGSLPTTHESQGSDMGLFGGLLGWEADDDRLPDSAQALVDAGITLRIETVDVGDPHPNTYRLTLKNPRETHTLIAISTGGGMMEIIEIDGVPLSIDGGWHETLIWQSSCDFSRIQNDLAKAETTFSADEVITHDLGDTRLIQVKSDRFCGSDGSVVRRLSPVLPVPSRKDIRVPFTSCAAMLSHDGPKNTPCGNSPSSMNVRVATSRSVRSLTG
jgi:L-serine dehydratase